MENKKIVLMGDIHGDVMAFNQTVVQNTDADLICQIGDFGFGFLSGTLPKYPANVKILCGNHDDFSTAIKKFPNLVLGNYGYIPEFDLGYIRGAWSIDWARRKPGKSWWPDEELTYSQMQEAIDYLEEKQPSIMITHDAPASCYPQLLVNSPFGLGYKVTVTTEGLDTLSKVIKPKVWYHGHHHCSMEYMVEGNDTKFICLGINEVAKINTQDLK